MTPSDDGNDTTYLDILDRLSSNDSNTTELILPLEKRNSRGEPFRCRDSYDMNALSNAVRSNTSLIKCELDGCKIGDEGLICLSKVLYDTKIETLSLDSNNITWLGATALSKELQTRPTCIKYLSLSCNKMIGDVGLMSISETLTSTNQKLSMLGLCNTSIGDDGITELGKVIGHANCCLEKLNLNCNEITDVGLASFANITFKKTENNDSNSNKLKSLHLSMNASIGDDGIVALFRCLAECRSSTLESLFSECNSLSDDGAYQISKVFKNLNTNLKLISLNINMKLTEVGIRSLIQEGLKYNNYIIDLRLQGLIIPRHKGLNDEINMYLKLNKAGRRLLKCSTISKANANRTNNNPNNSVKEEQAKLPYLWSILLSKDIVRNENPPNILYYFLLENNPILICSKYYNNMNKKE